MDLDSFCAGELRTLRDQNLEWKIRVLESGSDARVKINGKEVLLFCANNYLGLANHPKLKKAAREAAKTHGVGTGAVPVIAGTMDLHAKLQEKIAEFKGVEAALYTQTGFAANAGVLPALLREGDLAISDELNHGSIIDGLRLSKAERKVYAHKNIEELEKLLKEAQGKHGKILVITDGVFSMDGDIAPLKRIVELSKQYGAISYVDDAHGDGVLGNGRGIIDHAGVHGQVDIEVGTFSKAFGTVGGYVAGSRNLVDFCRNKSRSYLLSGGQPPATVAASTAALQLIIDKPAIVKKLWSNTKYFKKRMQALGFNLGESETPIVPVMLGDEGTAQKFAARLFEEGVFGIPIFFPMVAKGKARIRAQVNAHHSTEDLDFAVSVFEKVGREMGVI